MLHLTESDLRFVVETVATRRRDYDHIAQLLRDKEDLLEPMLGDPKLIERLFRDQDTDVSNPVASRLIINDLRKSRWNSDPS